MHYRLYRLDPATGGIRSGSDIDAASDGDAIARAREIIIPGDAPFELWRGTHRVLQHRAKRAASR